MRKFISGYPVLCFVVLLALGIAIYWRISTCMDGGGKWIGGLSRMASCASDDQGVEKAAR